LDFLGFTILQTQSLRFWKEGLSRGLMWSARCYWQQPGWRVSHLVRRSCGRTHRPTERNGHLL